VDVTRTAMCALDAPISVSCGYLCSDPAIDAKNRTLMSFAAYNAGPHNLKKFAAFAQRTASIRNLFNNVELGAAKSGLDPSVFSTSTNITLPISSPSSAQCEQEGE